MSSSVNTLVSVRTRSPSCSGWSPLYPGLGQLLLPLVELLPGLSTKLYSSNNGYKLTYLSYDFFLGLLFAQFLADLSQSVADLSPYAHTVEDGPPRNYRLKGNP